MISNERLGKIQYDLECWQQYYDPQNDADNHQLMGDAAMAIKELLALRKAFSEPAGYVDEFHFEKDVISSRLYVELSEAMSRHEYISFVPLYRKPPTE